MKISVITVCYNAGKDLEKTIKSVISQSYKDIEYIIIDGGSTDETKDILKKYSDKISKIISEPDKGLYDAMNKGINLASGDYINFMNAGDIFSDDEVVEKIVNALEADTDVIYGNSIMVTPRGDKIIDKVRDDISILKKRPIYRHNSSFTRRTLHRKFLFDISKSSQFRHALDYNHIFHIKRNGAKFQKTDINVVTWLKDGVSDKPIRNVILNFKISHQYNSPTLRERIIYYYDILKASRRELLKRLNN